MRRATFLISSLKKTEIVDITDRVLSFVKEQGMHDGLVLVRALHTTAGVFLNENEDGLHDDALRALAQLLPEGEPYRHDDFTTRKNIEEDERKNAHSHLRAMLLGHTVTVPVIAGRVESRMATAAMSAPSIATGGLFANPAPRASAAPRKTAIGRIGCLNQ